MWKEDLAGRKVTVSLGARDLIVDTESVGKYLSQGTAVEEGNISTATTDLKHRNTKHRKGNVTSATAANGFAENNDWKTRAWRDEGIEVLWWPNLDHAQVFDEPKTRKTVLDVIRTYCKV